MNRDGWVFADVLLTVAILAVSLSLLYPVLGNLQLLQSKQESKIRSAMEVPVEDAWKEYR
jgi:hypothetical protein